MSIKNKIKKKENYQFNNNTIHDFLFVMRRIIVGNSEVYQVVDEVHFVDVLLPVFDPKYNKNSILFDSLELILLKNHALMFHNVHFLFLFLFDVHFLLLFEFLIHDHNYRNKKY